MKPRKWRVEQLVNAASESTSIRQVIFKLGLKAAGGNYDQVSKYIRKNNIEIGHFKGKGWNKGLTGIGRPRVKIEEILVKGSSFQSFKLKRRLFLLGLKKRECELCGWAKMSIDGRIPLELDHINGDRLDNQLENLRILCPNCHSLQTTHRGRNKKVG